MTSSPSHHPPVHIILAEDSPTQAELLRHMLEQHGYTVTSTANGREALRSARATKPSLLISDIVMPEMDGYELCLQIKADPDLQSLPVILLTTLSDPSDVIRGLECGADNFVIKPYDDDYLLSRIELVLQSRGTKSQDQPGAGIEIFFAGQRHVITANRLQIMNLLLSTYEASTRRNQELVRMKDALRDANATLEGTNRELEAFSYSVSHDLRAPLRAIQGFSQGLLDCDPATAQGDRGRELLMRIQQACVRMQQLIEDLLTLSRIARGDLRKEPVNLSTLVHAVAQELQRQHPDRTVSLQITDGVFAECDARLMRIAIENLLGNAWKFTSKKPDARVEFGRESRTGRSTYFIRDNGAGFDMAYAEKLFGAFQRLHTTSEFPGTGIGLATVQRIIHRHGGRIWAQSSPDMGATFHFSI